MKSKMKAALPLTFSGLLLIGIYLWINDNTADFGLNFTTEVIGVVITVFLINYLIRELWGQFPNCELEHVLISHLQSYVS